MSLDLVDSLISERKRQVFNPGLVEREIVRRVTREESVSVVLMSYW
jgi:hypothetical protein